MSQPTIPDGNQIPLTPLYDPSGHQVVAERAYNVSTDATTGIVYGDPATGAGGGGSVTQYTDGQAPPTNPVGDALVFDNGGAWVDVGNDHPLPISGTVNTLHGSAVDATNSSTATLSANSVYTGTWQSSLNYSALSIEAYSDQASAASGLVIQQSQDGVNADTKDPFSVSASTPFQTTVNLTGKFYRVVYTNGGTNQGTFRLQTVAQTQDVVLPRTLTANGNLKVAIQEDNTAGLATSANQSTANTSLSSIVTNTSTTATNTANIGAQSDAAYTSGNGSVISVLKGIFTSLANILLLAFDSTSRLRISNYGKNAAAGDTALACDSGGNLYVNLLNTSGTPTLGAVNLRTNGASISTTNPLAVSQQGGSNTAIAAGTSANTVVKASSGRCCYILVTTTGTNALVVYDNASTNSGTIIAAIPANAAVGLYGPFLPAANGITVAGNAANPAVTINWA